MKAERIAKRLTKAQADAIRGAWIAKHPDLKGMVLISIDTNMGVRRRLFAMGLLGKRPPYPLSKLGRDVRDILLKGQP